MDQAAEMMQWQALDASLGEPATTHLRWGYAQIIASHWPENGSAQQRKERLERVMPRRGEQVPMAFVLTQSDRVIGGGVVRPLSAFSSAGVTASARGMGPVCVMVTVIVDGAHRGAGHGRRVVAYLEASARDCGFECMYLFSDDAIGFYAKLGYELVPAVAPHNGCTWMRKRLKSAHSVPTQLCGLLE
mmetsp:Transcript_28447/g.64432  ORF Transcript_28447/g.64432 Transcript_28447/m.64432 type:complete len:188 (-) Transcript_28447:136-699(-)